MFLATPPMEGTMTKISLVESSPYKGWTLRIFKTLSNWARPYFAELVDPAGRLVRLTCGSNPTIELSRHTTYGSLVAAREAARNAVNARIRMDNEIMRMERQSLDVKNASAAAEPSLLKIRAKKTIQEILDSYYITRS